MNKPQQDSIEDAYPSELGKSEKQAVELRRSVAGVEPGRPLVGFALSGGGIRSATFCLGFFQALARQKLIRGIDFLSTVSGGGYFGGFLGGAYTRENANPDTVEKNLADNQSWEVRWLRDNGRFLSPNGAGDNWQAAAVGLRNWVALNTVMLTFGFLLLGLAALIRADICSGAWIGSRWYQWEVYLWNHPMAKLRLSPWILLPSATFALVMVPSGSIYWLTQVTPLMKAAHWVTRLFRHAARKWSHCEFVARIQALLTRSFMVGFVGTVILSAFVVVDSLGQTAYFVWARSAFEFPSTWATFVAAGAGAYAFLSKGLMMVEGLLGKPKLQLPMGVMALIVSLAWLLIILCGLSAVVCGFAWDWDVVVTKSAYIPMTGDWPLAIALVVALALSCWFSYSFGFVNLSSLQQVYAARLTRAYIGATNPVRQRRRNYSMTEPISGDDCGFEDYAPHRQGGPLHLINVTVNETISGRTQIERCDRKGMIMALGPCGISVGGCSHALWGEDSDRPLPRSLILRAMVEDSTRPIRPIAAHSSSCFHALEKIRASGNSNVKPEAHRVEALSLGRWMAISGAAFTTGLGSGTQLGLSLLLGLANVRLGYWWDSRIRSLRSKQTTPATFTEIATRFLSWLMPVQMSLLNEFFARFHGPARQYWYLSDGGHFENTGCYELIRRRIPFIVCTDAGQDPRYGFHDFANLVRIARTDFGAEIQILQRKTDLKKEDPDPLYPLPSLEDRVHPDLLNVIGSLEDFTDLREGASGDNAEQAAPRSRRHAVLARIHYVDTHEMSWLLLIKPSLMGDETIDVLQYQRTHPLFPQEPTSDQYFDEAQWESYRKLGEHIGAELFSPVAEPSRGWTPRDLCPPKPILSKEPPAEDVPSALRSLRPVGVVS